MTDIVDKETRRRMMSGIRAKNTKPELLIRSYLHKAGFRFRIHNSKLPGKPDIVLRKYNTIMFINGCFWHRHACHLFKWPQTRPEFWKNKIDLNVENDLKAIQELKSAGWRICVVWECAIKGAKKDIPKTLTTIESWIVSNKKNLEIAG